MKSKEDLNNLSVVELESKLHKTKEDLFTAKLSNQGGALSNPLKIRALRRLTARIKTMLNAKSKNKGN